MADKAQYRAIFNSTTMDDFKLLAQLNGKSVNKLINELVENYISENETKLTQFKELKNMN